MISVTNDFVESLQKVDKELVVSVGEVNNDVIDVLGLQERCKNAEEEMSNQLLPRPNIFGRKVVCASHEKPIDSAL